MNKLNALKKWLTLEDAVSSISAQFNQPISISDLYQFALDGHLKLSVMFIASANAKKVRLVKSEGVEYKKVVPNIPNFPEGKCFNIPQNVESQISKDYWIQYVEPELLTLKGVWDLAMIGTEKLDIASRYHQATSGHTAKLPSFIGNYVEKNGEIYQLMIRQERAAESVEDNAFTEPNEHDTNEDVSIQEMRERLKQRPYRPPEYSVASTLADYEHTLVLRTTEINRFIQSLEDQPTQSKASETNATNSILCLLAAVLAEHNYDWNQRGISTSFVAMTDKISTHLDDGTILKILKKIDSAVESRSK
ncbi:MAG: hypothetical protein V7784_17845 [Oceanospirillaceae bacterium]